MRHRLTACQLATAVIVQLLLATFATAVRAQGVSRLPQEPVTPLPQWHAVKPNVVYVLCDDLGYGDVHAMNPDRGKIPTPNMDRLASQGMTFTDAHASSSMCTPSRYAILTGRYDWRSRLQSDVLGGDSPPLLAPGRLTVAAMLKQQGYSTACIGKWHLGLTFGPGHYRGPIADGPLQHGFDTFFGISASLDMSPFAFIDGDRFPQVPTLHEAWARNGVVAPGFEPIDVLPTLVTHACDVVRHHAAAAPGADHRPFFLYLALTAPHTPLVPTKEWQGKSGLGPYGDFVMETDWALGQVLRSLDDAGLAEQTIVCFTSDNGCSPFAGVKQLEAKGHYPSAHFRGYKSDIWDGGHREPFLVRWPGTVAAGARCEQTVCLGDLMATLAQVTGTPLPADAGEDSFSLVPILLGAQHGPLRYAQVHHSKNGNFGLRQGKWKLELCPGSGGWGTPTDKQARARDLPAVQLYDMDADPGEQHNVEAEHPDLVSAMTKLLEQAVADGRTTPGPVQHNDVPVDIWKLPKTPAAPTEGHE